MFPFFRQVTWLFVVALVGISSACPVAAQTNRPNILFVLTEDAGAFDSVVGTPGVQTPGLESIANRGLYFSNAHVAAPVCSVSKAALLTGLMPHSNNLRTNVFNYFPGANGIAAGDIAPGDTTGRLNQMITGDRNNNLNSRFAIHDDVPTLVEVLNDEGYYTGVTHKLHVSGVDRFPYDHWIDGEDPSALNKVAAGAAANDQPFFLLYNTPEPHRPYSNSDNTTISVDPQDVVVPGQFVNTAVSRQDWAEHLDGIESADNQVVDVLSRLDNLGLTDNTIVVFMADHGPSWHRGKQSTYDFGSRVSLAIAGPGVVAGAINDTVVNEIDLMPTLLDMVGVTDQPAVQGKSIASVLAGTPIASGEHRYSVTEVQHDVRLTDSGQNEKKITDGDHSLIFRFNHTGKRELNQDQYQSGSPWNNRIYDETIRVYNELQANPGNFSMAEAERVNRSYRFLDEMDSSTTRNLNLFENAEIELFDNQADPYELNNLINGPASAQTRERLLTNLYSHTIKTNDTYVDARLIPATGVTGDHFQARVTGSNLANDSRWTTPITGNGSADFTFAAGGIVDAPGGPRALATFETEVLQKNESFLSAIDVSFAGAGVGAGMVFGFEDDDNFYEFQLLDGSSAIGGANKDVRLRRMKDGVESNLLFHTDLENIDRNEFYRLVVDYDALESSAELSILTEHGVPYFTSEFAFAEAIAAESQFGISTWSSGSAQFDRFDLMITSALPGDFDFDGDVDAYDVDLLSANLGLAVGDAANPGMDLDEDGTITLADHDQHVTTLVMDANGTGALIGDLNLDGDVDISQIAIGPGGVQNFGDASVLLASLGQTSGQLYGDGDLNGDGDVDVSQIVVGAGGIQNLGDASRLLANLGQTTAAAAATSAVPEPSSLTVLAIAGIGAFIRRR